ncbi:protein kinase domain-containing protein [Micromonospora sp. DT231]|uniref:protein kinase domain-containing protein n=1 Tax=Micromonospora sp. DT231 TaxID=3416526 RepID=UPI003CE6B549
MNPRPPAEGDVPPTRREADQAVDPGPQVPATRREHPAESGVAVPVTAGLLRLPDRVSGWSVIAALPAGAEADVFLLRDAAGHDRVLKIYRPGIVIDEDAVDRLIGLRSERLVTPIDFGVAEGRRWELTEYLPAGTLADFVDQSPRPMPPELLRHVVAELTEALGELHSATIVHGDLKPSNIMVRSLPPDLRLALADFGLSRYLGPASVRFTSRGVTFAYAAPESFAGAYSPAGDWWAVGVVVRQLATGQAPFEGLDERIIQHEVTVRGASVDGVADHRLRLLCEGLLVSDPDHRWGEAQVRRWLSGGSPEVHRPASTSRAAPLILKGVPYRTRAQVARAMAAHWSDAADMFLRRVGTRKDPGEGWRVLRAWLEQFDDDVDERIRLIDQTLTHPDHTPDVRMVHLLRWLDRGQPATYLGLRVGSEHLADAAAVAVREPDGRAATAVRDLWRYSLLPVLADFGDGQALVQVDTRWRSSAQDLDALATRVDLPPQASSMLAARRTEHRAVLLSVAADPDRLRPLLDSAVRDRGEITEHLDWFEALPPVTDVASALCVLTVVPAAVQECAGIVEARTRGQRVLDEELKQLKAGRPKALLFAAAASLIWALAVAAPVFLPHLLPDPRLVIRHWSVPVAEWLVPTLAEVGFAVRAGSFYHPRWSALDRMRWLARRVPTGWAALRRGANRVRGGAPPLLLGVLTLACCCGVPFLWSAGLLAVAMVALIGPLVHLGWTGTRIWRFGQVRRQRSRDLLGSELTQRRNGREAE